MVYYFWNETDLHIQARKGEVLLFGNMRNIYLIKEKQLSISFRECWFHYPTFYTYQTKRLRKQLFSDSRLVKGFACLSYIIFKTQKAEQKWSKGCQKRKKKKKTLLNNVKNLLSLNCCRRPVSHLRVKFEHCLVQWRAWSQVTTAMEKWPRAWSIADQSWAKRRRIIAGGVASWNRVGNASDVEASQYSRDLVCNLQNVWIFQIGVIGMILVRS